MPNFDHYKLSHLLFHCLPIVKNFRASFDTIMTDVSSYYDTNNPTRLLNALILGVDTGILTRVGENWIASLESANPAVEYVAQNTHLAVTVNNFSTMLQQTHVGTSPVIGVATGTTRTVRLGNPTTRLSTEAQPLGGGGGGGQLTWRAEVPPEQVLAGLTNREREALTHGDFNWSRYVENPQTPEPPAPLEPKTNFYMAGKVYYQDTRLLAKINDKSSMWANRAFPLVIRKTRFGTPERYMAIFSDISFNKDSSECLAIDFDMNHFIFSVNSYDRLYAYTIEAADSKNFYDAGKKLEELMHQNGIHHITKSRRRVS